MAEATETDPLDPRGEEAAIAKAATAERRQQQIAISDFKWLMNHKQGRRFMWRLLDMTNVFGGSFTGQAPYTDFNEGKREIGVKHLHRIFDLCPERFTDMLTEHKNDD